MSILNKLLHKCNYKCGGKIKKYDTGGAFAHAGMNNDEKAAYIKSNRDLAMQRAAMPEKHGTLLVMDKDKGVVASIYTGSYTPKKYTFNSGVPTSSTNIIQPATNYEADGTTLTYEDAKNVASKVLKEKGRDDISEDEFAKLLYYQAILESGLGTKGLGARTNNPLNWGNFGDGTRRTSFPDKITGFETAAKGILDNYLIEGKSVNDLLTPGGYKNRFGNFYDKSDYGLTLKTMMDKDEAKKSQTGGAIEKDNAQKLLDRMVLDNNNKSEKDKLSSDDLYNLWKFATTQIVVESNGETSPNTLPSKLVFNGKNNSSNIANNNPVNIRDTSKPKDPITKLYPFKEYDDKSNTTGINDYIGLITGPKYLNGDLSKENVDRLVNSGYERTDYLRNRQKGEPVVHAYYDDKPFGPDGYVAKNKRVRNRIDRNLTFPEVPVFGKKPTWLADKEKYIQSHPISKEVNNYYKDNNLTYPVMGENIPPVIQEKYDADTSKHVLKNTLRNNPRKVKETTPAYKDRIVNRTYNGVTVPITYLKEAVEANPNMIKNKRTFRDAINSIFHQTGGVYLPPIKKKEDLFNSVKKGEVFSVESKPATMVHPELNPTILAPVEITARKYGWNRDLEKYRNEQRQRSPIGQLFHHKSDEKIKRQYVPRLLDNLDTDTNDLALDKTESDFINKYGDKAQKRFYKTVNTDDYLTQDQKWKKAQVRAMKETALDNLPEIFGVDLGDAVNKAKIAKDFIQGNWGEAAASLIKIPGGREVDYAVNLAKDNPSGYSVKDIQDKYLYQPKLYMDNPAIPLKIGFQRLLDPSLPKLSEVNNPELQEFITYYMQRGHDYKSALNAYNNVKQKRDKIALTSTKTTYKDGKIVYGEKKTDKLMDFVKGIVSQRQPYK